MSRGATYHPDQRHQYHNIYTLFLFSQVYVFFGIEIPIKKDY